MTPIQLAAEIVSRLPVLIEDRLNADSVILGLIEQCVKEPVNGPTVLNIASKCPKCETVFEHEVNVYDLAVMELKERAEKTEAAYSELQSKLHREVIAHHNTAAACTEMRRLLPRPKYAHTLGAIQCPECGKTGVTESHYSFCALVHALSLDCGRGHIPASELDKTIETYNYIEAIGGCGYQIHDRVRIDKDRLESLRKESK